jgi:hypothetical protein
MATTKPIIGLGFDLISVLIDKRLLEGLESLRFLPELLSRQKQIPGLRLLGAVLS